MAVAEPERWPNDYRVPDFYVCSPATDLEPERRSLTTADPRAAARNPAARPTCRVRVNGAGPSTLVEAWET